MKLRGPRSLFGQLVLSQILLMLAMGTIVPIVLAYVLDITADRFVSARLSRDAQAIAAGSETGPGGGGPSRTGPRSWARAHRFTVFDTNGAVIKQSLVPLPLRFSELPTGLEPAFFKRGQFDMLSLPTRIDDKIRWIVVAQDRSVPEGIVDDVVTSFLARFVWIVPVSLLASLLIGLLVMRRVTSRFRRSAQQADAISLHRIDVRLRAEDLPLEAEPLVNATNRALDRLEAGYRFQGEFVGNVAHELRTPLALISLRTEGLDPSPERDLILLGVERANHVVRQLMELAAIDRHHPEVVSFDPCILVTELVGVMAPLVFERNHVIAFSEPDRPPPLLLGVPALIEIALSNLIDNAVRHTPAGCTVTVCVEADGLIVVEDDGPGLAIDARDGDNRRYRREDTARSDGAGLGLSIVQRIITVCEGSLDIGNSPSGGARCALRLRTALRRPRHSL